MKEHVVDGTVKREDYQIITEAGILAENYGLTRVAGSLIALLFLEAKPISITEMRDRLGVSKPSISTNIRFLERWRIVRKVPVRHDRQDYYVFTDDLWEALAEAFASTFQRDARRFLAMLKTAADRSDDAGADAVRARLQAASELYLAAETVMSGILRDRAEVPPPITRISVE